MGEPSPAIQVRDFKALETASRVFDRVSRRPKAKQVLTLQAERLALSGQPGEGEALEAVEEFIRWFWDERTGDNGGRLKDALLELSIRAGVEGRLTLMEWLERAAEREMGDLRLSDKDALFVFPGALKTIPIDGTRNTPDHMSWPAMAFEAPKLPFVWTANPHGPSWHLRDQRGWIYDNISFEEARSRVGRELLPNRVCGVWALTSTGYAEVLFSAHEVIEAEGETDIWVRPLGPYQFGGSPNWLCRMK